mmetsp:Transcript_60861/g.83569  ORF Transcript_60861/g.83569 Transcript_60861/m.83569 type:complete len:132 (-) Transcript_60861:1250-1645(-)
MQTDTTNLAGTLMSQLMFAARRHITLERWYRVDACYFSVFTKKSFEWPRWRIDDGDVFKDESSHGIGGISHKDARRQKWAVDNHVSYNNVAEIDTALCWAPVADWVDKATLIRKVHARFVLLLWPNPNGPP